MAHRYDLPPSNYHCYPPLLPHGEGAELTEPLPAASPAGEGAEFVETSVEGSPGSAEPPEANRVIADPLPREDERNNTLRTPLLPMGLPQGVHIMCITGVRGCGIKTQARCLRMSLENHNVVVAAIDVGSYHTQAPRCEVCRPQGSKTETTRFCVACPQAVGRDRLFSAVSQEVDSLTSCVEFAQGSGQAVLIPQGKTRWP